MLLFFRIRYLDTRDKQFKDRDLWLETDALDPLTKAAIEATHDLKDIGGGREMLRYRHLFQEKYQTDDGLRALCERHGGMGTVFIPDYFEDETGQELTFNRMAVALTGNPDARLFPATMKKYDIDYILAEKRPIPIDQITLPQDQLNVLGYFVRDLRELLASAFYKDGPGMISSGGGSGRYVLKTAVSDEEIRSFVTIFRRLYMQNEPANFVKAVAAFHEAVQGYALANWVQGIADEYQQDLDQEPDRMPMTGRRSESFSRKRLIDVFLYTQYAHQPLGKNQQRAEQFQECLTSLGGDRALLTWIFLTEVWKCALHIRNAGVIIAEFFDHYCRCHKVTGDVLPSVQSDHSGIGTLEKKEAREARVLREKAEGLAVALWDRAGRPEGGHTLFINQALEQIMGLTGRTRPGRA